jgi:hypothetical protein
MPKPGAVCASTDISIRISMDSHGRQVLCADIMHKIATIKSTLNYLLLIQFHNFPCPGSNHNSVYISVYVIELTDPEEFSVSRIAKQY